MITMTTTSSSSSSLSKSNIIVGTALVLSTAIVLFEVLPIDAIVITPAIRVAAIGTTAAVISPPTITMTAMTKTPKQQTYRAKYYSDEHNIAAVGGSSGIVALYYNDDGHDKKFIHSSVRIEEQVLESLQKEAQRRGVSFNNLVNRTLKNYVTSEMYFEQLGFILVSKDFLRNTFSRLNENDIEEFGRDLGLTVAREYMLYFFPQVNNATIVEFLDIWFRRFQFYQHRVEERLDGPTPATTTTDLDSTVSRYQKQQVHIFTVSHDINMNFSLALKAILEGLVEPITKSPVIFKDITATSIAFSIKF
jgi:hypothetical protein